MRRYYTSAELDGLAERMLEPAASHHQGIALLLLLLNLTSAIEAHLDHGWPIPSGLLQLHPALRSLAVNGVAEVRAHGVNNEREPEAGLAKRRLH